MKLLQEKINQNNPEMFYIIPNAVFDRININFQSIEFVS